MKNIKYKDILKQNNISQSIFLLLSTVIGLALGFLINSLLTRGLGRVDYGNYALLINVYAFCQTIFNFGFYYVLSRLPAITTNPVKNRGYYMVGSFVSILLYVVMTISLIVYTFISDSIYINNLQTVMLLTLPFSWVYLFTTLNESFLQGDNKINLLAWSRLLPKFIFVLFLILVYFLAGKVVLLSALILHFIAFVISYIYVFIKIRPTFLFFKRRWKEVLVANKRFGLDIYIGSIVASGSAALSGILIGSFGLNNTEVGYYTLATLLVSPLSLIPNIIATVQFKEFAKSERISSKVVFVTFLLSAFVFVLIYFFSSFFIEIIFGKEFSSTVSVLKVLALGYLLYGFGDFYNRFLLSKGRGRELRNASILVGVTLLIGNIIFIKYFGAMGASYARISSGVMYSAVIFYYYNKGLRV